MGAARRLIVALMVVCLSAAPPALANDLRDPAVAAGRVQPTGSPEPVAPGDDSDGLPLWPVALGLGVLALGTYALRRKKSQPRDDLAEGSYGIGD